MRPQRTLLDETRRRKNRNKFDGGINDRLIVKRNILISSNDIQSVLLGRLMYFNSVTLYISPRVTAHTNQRLDKAH